jgi:S1 RNA binding domain protein
MQLEVGAVLEGKVTGITKFGVFVELPEGKTGMVHISEVATAYVKEIREHITENQIVKVKVLGIDNEGRISLSIKRAIIQARPPRPESRTGGSGWTPKSNDNKVSFEDMMSKFKQTSDEKMSDLKKVTEAKRGGFSRRGSPK